MVVLGAGYALAATWQLARWLFAIPILTYKGARPGQALRDGAEMTHGRLRRIVPPLVIWWLLVTVAALGIAWAARQVSDAGLDWAGIDVRRVLPLVALFVMMAGAGTFLYSAVHLAGQQFLVTRMYAEQVDAAKWRVPATLEIGEQLARPMARRVILTSLALLALSLTVAWIVASRLDLERVVAVTAHRGAKVTNPENTLAAFKAAMEAGATFIELDVQHTRDGQIVVLHDADFMRMGSDPRKIAALTGVEVATIDIGRKYDPKFTGEHAPTLEEVIDLVQGPDEDQRRAQVQRARLDAGAGSGGPAATQGLPGPGGDHVTRLRRAQAGGEHRALAEDGTHRDGGGGQRGQDRG